MYSGSSNTSSRSNIIGNYAVAVPLPTSNAGSFSVGGVLLLLLLYLQDVSGLHQRSCRHHRWTQQVLMVQQQRGYQAAAVGRQLWRLWEQLQLLL
jgi:hypothetical protein